jgi:hypothetical protein
MRSYLPNLVRILEVQPVLLEQDPSSQEIQQKTKTRTKVQLLQTWVKKGSKCEVPLKMQLRA